MKGKPIIYPNVKLGKNVKVWHFALIRSNTEIGDDSVIGSGVIIDGNVKIGKNASIQSRAYIPPYTTIGNNVFIGPCAIFTNDKRPPNPKDLKGAIVRDNARIGAGAIILPNIIIGENAMVGAGAVVTHSVGKGQTVVGNPARVLIK